MKRLKVGIIGLGTVAQIIHLPILEVLHEKFEIAALCDISPGLLQWAGEKYGVKNLYSDAKELTRQQDLDVVFVLNSSEYHAECAIGALQQGKHVLIEKPMVLNTADADAIIAAKNKSGKKVLVGYMRRYAPAFTLALEEMKSLGEIQYVKVRGLYAYYPFIKQTSNVRVSDDIPSSVKQERQLICQQMIDLELGDISQNAKDTFSWLCGLGCHDLSAMREMIGMPRRVTSASQAKGGGFLVATFEYDDFFATYEMIHDKNGRFDAHIEVFGETKSLKVQYNSPYIRHLPTTLTISETQNEEHRESVIRPTFTDNYTVEIEYFYDVIAKDLEPKTSPEDYKEDLTLFKMISNAVT